MSNVPVQPDARRRTFDAMQRLVAMMLPNGKAGRVAAIGLRAREFKLDAELFDIDSHAREKFNLIWLAPSSTQCSSDWLGKAARHCASVLSEDGLLFVLPPKGTQTAIVRALQAVHFSVDVTRGFRHAGGRQHVMVPLTLPAIDFVFTSVFPGHARIRRLASSLVRAIGADHSARLWPVTGFAAHRTGELPPFSWIASAGKRIDSAVIAVDNASTQAGSAILHVLDQRGTHTHVVKLSVSMNGNSIEALMPITHAAKACGARIAQVEAVVLNGTCNVTIQSALAGHRAIETVRNRASMTALVDRVDEWLRCWNRETRHDASLQSHEVDEQIWTPFAAVAPGLPDAQSYAATLRQLLAQLASSRVPRVAVHRDLTLFNILVDQNSRKPGIIDWDTAHPNGWPLTDLEYMIVDAVAAVDRYRNRVDAFRACFHSNGAYASVMSSRRDAHAKELALPPAFSELCHHATWLHHAANEQRKRGDYDGPFVNILRLLAAGHARE